MTTLFTAGSRPTADRVNLLVPLYAYKASDLSRSSTTTAADDTELLHAVEANATYQAMGGCMYTAAGGAGAGQFRIGWSGPSGASFSAYGVTGLVVNGASGVSGSVTMDGGTAISDTRTFGAAGTGTPVHMTWWATLVIGTTPGTFTVQWAQAASSGTATTLKAGSWLRLQRMA